MNGLRAALLVLGVAVAGFAVATPGLAQTTAPLPAGLAAQFRATAEQRGPAALLQELDQTLKANPALAASPDSAVALARVAAEPVSLLRGANTPVYRDIINHIIAAAPAENRDAVAKAVIAEVSGLALAETGPASQSPYVQVPLPRGEEFVRPEMKPQKTKERVPAMGIEVGPFLVLPEVQIAEFYDNNIFATSNSKKSDFVTVISPHVLAESKGARHKVDLEGHIDATRYRDHGSEDSDDFRVNGEGQYDLTTATQVYGGLLYLRAHEDRESPDDVNGIEPTVYHESRAYAGASQQISNWTLRAGGTAERLTFRDTQTTLGTFNNADRDRIHYTAGAYAGYQLNEVFTPYVEALGDFRRYDNTRDDSGFARDSNGYRIDVGSKVKLSGKLDGEAYVGYMTQDYDDARFSTVNALAYSGNLRWRALPPTLITAYVDRSIEETTLFGASSYLYSSLGLTVEQTLTEKLLLTLRGSVGQSKFQDIARTDDDYDTGFGLRYLINRYFYVAGDYRYQRRTSSVVGVDYNRNEVFLRVGAQY